VLQRLSTSQKLFGSNALQFCLESRSQALAAHAKLVNGQMESNGGLGRLTSLAALHSGDAAETRSSMLKIVLKVFHFDFRWIGMCKTRQGRLNLECQEDNSSTRDSWGTSICLMRASSSARVEILVSLPPVFAQDVVARADNVPTLRCLHLAFRFSSQMKWWQDRSAGFLTS
jgi:hypothetical protein